MYILYAILGFIILIMIHELGHFIACRLCGVKVEEFGLGIPPKIKTLYKDKKGTEYTLNAIPLGGFIRPKGEDVSDDSQVYDKDSIHSQPFWKKFVILISGVVMNLIIAFLLFFGAFASGIKPIFIIPDAANNISSESYLFPSDSFAKKVGYIQNTGKNDVVIEGIISGENILANKIGLEIGDKLISVDGEKINTNNLGTILKTFIGKNFNLEIERNGDKSVIETECQKESCLLGIQYSSGRTIQGIKMNISEAFLASIHEIKAQTVLTFEGLKLLYNNIADGKPQEAVEKMSGPVGAVAISGYVLKLGIWEYLAFFGMISLALAIFNVLPIPALDGGRIMTTAVMHIFRLNPKKYLVIENYISLLFFGLLLILGIFIMYKDYIRFF